MKNEPVNMVSKVFLDANVLLDLFLKRSNYEEAEALLSLIITGEVKGYITPSIVHSVGYWVTKYYGNTVTKNLLLTLLIDVKIIEMDHEMTLLALQSNIDDIEDALQYYTAIHHQLNYFISRDKAFQKAAAPNLPVVSAKYFLEMIA